MRKEQNKVRPCFLAAPYKRHGREIRVSALPCVHLARLEAALESFLVRSPLYFQPDTHWTRRHTQIQALGFHLLFLFKYPRSIKVLLSANTNRTGSKLISEPQPTRSLKLSLVKGPVSAVLLFTKLIKF